MPFVWSEKCEKAFRQLKISLTSPPILIFPDFLDTFIVTTDASRINSENGDNYKMSIAQTRNKKTHQEVNEKVENNYFTERCNMVG